MISIIGCVIPRLSIYWKNLGEKPTKAPEKINKFDSNGNLILFYFINELIKLYKYNDNKVIRMNLTSLLIDYININFI